MLPGDGIGPEVCFTAAAKMYLFDLKMIEHIKRIFLFANVPVDFEEIKLSSSDLTDEALENAIVAIRRNGVALKVCICKFKKEKP